ncbi:MAG TPA: PASTA domain-containing protein [Thermoleophilaceae bacterium]
MACALAFAASADAADLALDPGESVFWDGETVADANVRSPALCGSTGPCFSYALRIAAPARRLRAAIDTPSRTDTFELALIDPSGATAAAVQNSNRFNEEAFVDSPVPGAWTVRVMPKGATDAFFRLRAKLEAARPDPAAGHVPILPNLRTVPPYEFSFIAPANPLNGVYPPDTVNPPADAAGVHPISCTADEMAPREAGGFAAKRCLRLTSGPVNVGPGPFEMRFRFAEDVSEGEGTVQPEGGTIQRGPAFQAVHYADGSVETRPAGTYSYHVTHAHFHDDNVLTYELFRVTDDRTGALAAAGGGTKSGFCPADQLFGEWHRFDQGRAGTYGHDDVETGRNCFSPSEGLLGLTVGWGDVYRWQRPGQYVEFGSNPDGLYVVRSTVDRDDEVLETSEEDNVAYALIAVAGDRVDLLERGRGTSPWDPARIVFRGPGPMGGQVTPASRPEDAPVACRVPTLVGRTLGAAKRRLRTRGCELGKVKRPRRARDDRGLVVVGQSRAAGRLLPRDSRVGVRLGWRR